MNSSNVVVVAVDGPAASGKSSICALAASNLGWDYVNTGAIYRAIAWLACKFPLESEESGEQKLVELFKKHCSWDCQTARMHFDGTDITDELSSTYVGNKASTLAKQSSLRELLLPVQRDFIERSKNGIILDGRDIATVVAPNAQIKVFMTASLAKRASRRLQQLQGNREDLENILVQMAERDKQDSEREIAPLRAPENAVLLDTSDLDFGQSVNRLQEIIQEKCKT